VTAAAVWLALGIGLLIWLTSRRADYRMASRTASRDAALALLLSALPYAFAYLVIGVATELRYLLWSLIAIFTAAVISLPLPRTLTIPGRHRRAAPQTSRVKIMISPTTDTAHTPVRTHGTPIR